VAGATESPNNARQRGEEDMRRMFVATVAVAAAIAGFTGSAFAADGQGLCIGSANSAIKPASNGECPHGGTLVEVAMQSEVSQLRTKVLNLENTNSRLSAQVATLHGKVTALEQKLSKVSYQADGLNGWPTLKISGANLQIVNGRPDTTRVNGLGNLIVGYDADAGPSDGSHNIIVGDKQTFTSYGGIMAGSQNTLSAPRSVVFGFGNTAGGEWSSVTAGNFNTAAGVASSITGGAYSTATGVASSITGGTRNAVGAEWGTVSGGIENAVAGKYAAVGGGQDNRAKGEKSWIGGGEKNHAIGDWSAILGGQNITLDNAHETSP
jgi:hypothetical protein